MSGTSGEAMAEDWSELDTGGAAALTNRRQGASFPARNTERSASHTHICTHTHEGIWFGSGRKCRFL